MNLGKQFAHLFFLMDIENDGTVILHKAAVLPERDLWIHENPKALASLKKGLQQAKEKKLKKNAIDLDAFTKHP